MVRGSNFYPFDYHNDTFYVNNKNDSFCWFEQMDIKTPLTVLSAT